MNVRWLARIVPLLIMALILHTSVARADNDCVTGFDDNLTLPCERSTTFAGAAFKINNASGNSSASAVNGNMTATSPDGLSAGVRGNNYASTGKGAGVMGQHFGAGAGVMGAAGSSGIGVSGSGGTGVYASGGIGLVALGTRDAIDARTSASGFSAVYAHHDGASTGYGVYATTGAGVGVSAWNTASNNTGQLGLTSDGVRGVASSVNGNGVIGVANNGASAYGVWGQSSTGYAGYFTGKVQVSGSFAATGAKSFVIDHPLDPANQYLYHAAIESPDMKNLYDGVAVLDARGAAVVQLPAWFEALNQEYRYQLTAIGAPTPGLYVAQEIAKNRFAIAGGIPGMKVSWQVTGIRHDPYATAHRMRVEVAKSAPERNQYLYPEGYAQPAAKQLHAAKHEQVAASDLGPEPLRVLPLPATER